MATPAENHIPQEPAQGNLTFLELKGLNASIPREVTRHENIGANPTATQCASRLALPQGLVLSVVNIEQINIS